MTDLDRYKKSLNREIFSTVVVTYIFLLSSFDLKDSLWNNLDYGWKSAWWPFKKNFHKVIKEDYPIEKFGVSSLENNEIVMQILEAAKHSAQTGQVVEWASYYK